MAARQKSWRLGSVLAIAMLMPIAAMQLQSQPVAFAQTTSSSSPTQPPLIGIVDINGVLERSTAIARLRQVIDEENENFQQAIEQERRELEEAERQLTAERDNLDEEEFNRRRQEFDNRVISIQQRVQRNRRAFDASLREANEQIRGFLVQIISDIAAERGFALILQRQHAVVFDTALDISAEALTRLDERTRDIKITPSSRGDQ